MFFITSPRLHLDSLVLWRNSHANEYDQHQPCPVGRFGNINGAAGMGCPGKLGSGGNSEMSAFTRVNLFWSVTRSSGLHMHMYTAVSCNMPLLILKPILGIVSTHILPIQPCEGKEMSRKSASNTRAEDDLQILIVAPFWGASSSLPRSRGQAVITALDSQNPLSYSLSLPFRVEYFRQITTLREAHFEVLQGQK